jgi:hypothetical protein
MARKQHDPDSEVPIASEEFVRKVPRSEPSLPSDPRAGMDAGPSPRGEADPGTRAQAPGFTPRSPARYARRRHTPER